MSTEDQIKLWKTHQVKLTVISIVMTIVGSLVGTFWMLSSNWFVLKTDVLTTRQIVMDNVHRITVVEDTSRSRTYRIQALEADNRKIKQALEIQ